jgi:hypothetical protein
MSWIIVENKPGEVHVLPKKERDLHILSEDCKCGVSVNYTGCGEKTFVHRGVARQGGAWRS